MWPNETVEKLGLLYSAKIEGVSLATFAAKMRVFLVDCALESTIEDDKGGQYNFLVRWGKTTFFLSLARITDDPLVIRFRVFSGLERHKPDAFVARLNPWLEHYYATRLEKGGDPASPTGKTQTGAGALPIPEGKTKYSPEDWAKIFRATSGEGWRPDFFEIAKLTGKTYATVKNEHSKWINRQSDELSP